MCRPKCNREIRTLSVLMQCCVIKTSCFLNQIELHVVSGTWDSLLGNRRAIGVTAPTLGHCGTATSKRDHVTCMSTFGFVSCIFRILERQYFRNSLFVYSFCALLCSWSHVLCSCGRRPVFNKAFVWFLMRSSFCKIYFVWIKLRVCWGRHSRLPVLFEQVRAIVCEEELKVTSSDLY